MDKQLTAAIYARVSTKDKGQDTENQLSQLRKYAAKQEWETVEFIDHASGKHADRDGLTKLFEAASRREIDVVLVWALDRFTRQGIFETFEHIAKLSKYGVSFESLTEPQFRTTGATGELMLAIAAWIAKQERIRISERTKAGLATARAKGKILGRPRIVFRIDLAEQMRAAGKSWRAISRELGIPHATIRKALSERKASLKPAKRGVQKTPSKPRR
jgi:DNA invertase Pin-like site-specific DNA recombinase